MDQYVAIHKDSDYLEHRSHKYIEKRVEGGKIRYIYRAAKIDAGAKLYNARHQLARNVHNATRNALGFDDRDRLNEAATKKRNSEIAFKQASADARKAANDYDTAKKDTRKSTWDYYTKVNRTKEEASDTLVKMTNAKNRKKDSKSKYTEASGRQAKSMAELLQNEELYNKANKKYKKTIMGRLEKRAKKSKRAKKTYDMLFKKFN